jgi:tRNA1Val (adenine37-N6)-methyltransferase
MSLYSIDTPISGSHYEEDKLSCWKCRGTGMKPQKKSQPAMVCSVCFGKKYKEKQRNDKHRPYRPFKTPEWDIPGPKAKYDMLDPVMIPGEHEMLSSLAGHWFIYQLEHGHRMTTDDVGCAAIACKHMDGVSNHLDIGTGLGSVLNMVQWYFYGSIKKSVGLEAQKIHVELARRTIEFNGIADRCEVRHQDIRLLNEDDVSELFDLITGTPPYFPAPNGSLPAVAGRAMCAFELRGGVEWYCKIASWFLKPSGKFVVAQTGIEIERTERAGRDCGLIPTSRWEFQGKRGKPCLFVVFVFEKVKDASIYPVHKIDVRDELGQFTAEYEELMTMLGKPPCQFEPHTVPSNRKK